MKTIIRESLIIALLTVGIYILNNYIRKSGYSNIKQSLSIESTFRPSYKSNPVMW